MPSEGTTAQREATRLGLASRLLVLVALLLFVLDLQRGVAGFYYDDAGMFLRYALHVRSGFGISWNPGGPHTAGLTSPLWLIPVLFGTFLHQPVVPMLVRVSGFFGLLALLALTWVVRSGVQTPWLRRFDTLFVLISLPLLAQKAFIGCMTNGMETMLGMLMICVLVAAARHFCASATARSAATLAVAGVVCILARPESGLCVVTVPVLMWFWASPRSKRALTFFFGSFAVGLALLLLLHRLYFGTFVPLPFYVKATHGYRGRSYFPNPMELLFQFLDAGWPALVVLLLFADRRRWRTYAVFLLPLALVFSYLFTVLQVMGDQGRYYMPYLPLLYIPALEALDHWWSSGKAGTPRPLRFAAVLLLPAMLLRFEQVPERALNRLLVRGKTIYKEADVRTAAKTPLPALSWYEANEAFARYAASLGDHPRFALTEAGIVGATVPQDFVLDMAGLNDREIALHGPSTDYLFGQHPDIIWMPHTTYTWLRGKLLSDPRLLNNYDVYAGAFDYGVAICRHCPDAAAYHANLLKAWETLYPGTNPEAYRATAISWDETPQRP